MHELRWLLLRRMGVVKVIAFVRDLAGVWADNRFIRANRVLRSRLAVAEASVGRLAGSVERLRTRRAIDRDVRVRAEVAVQDLTAANLKLAGAIAVSPVTAQADPVVVAQRLDACYGAVEVWLEAYGDWLAAERAYKAAYNTAYIEGEGPEHLRRPAAELVAAELRAVRDDAEVAWRSAERGIRLSELGLRVATQGATDDPAPTPAAGERS